MKNEALLKKCLQIILLITPFFYGMFYAFCGGVVSVILAVVCICYFVKQNQRKLRWTAGFILTVVLVVGYVISSLWAVDSGMALLESFKYIWIFLFVLLYIQLSGANQRSVVNVVPYSAFVMAMIGIVAYFIPFLNNNYYSNQRLVAGFQYANTTALFFLIGIWMLLCEKPISIHWQKYVMTIVMTIALLLTGSRTTLILFILAILVLAFKYRNRKLLAGLLCMVAGVVVYILATGNWDNIGRIATISLQDSTLIGRLLYWQDALPLLWDHPFGMGELGYYYSISSMQTGVYSVMYVHNDYLQLALDLGWLVLFLYVGTVGYYLVKKKACFKNKVLLILILIHGCMEFDLKYSVILLLILLLLSGKVTSEDMQDTSDHSVKESEVSFVPLTKKRKWVLRGLIVLSMLILIVTNAYMAVVSYLHYNGKEETAVRWYPYYTEAYLSLLSVEEDLAKAKNYAEHILDQNDTSYLAYHAKAMLSYYDGDFSSMIAYENAAIARNWYSNEAYENAAILYYSGMDEAYGLYGTDEEKFQLCVDGILDLEKKINHALKKQSALGKKIDDQPEFKTNKTIQEVIDLAKSYQ